MLDDRIRHAEVFKMSFTNKDTYPTPSNSCTCPQKINNSENSKSVDCYNEVKEINRYNYIWKEGIYTMDFSPNGNQLAIGFGDSAVEIINTTTLKLEKEVVSHKYGSNISLCTKFNPKFPILICTDGRGSVLSYNLENNSCKELVLESDTDYDEILCMDFSSDGTTFATAGKSMEINIYDSKTARNLWTLPGYDANTNVDYSCGHARRVFALRFHPENNDIFLSGGWDGHIKVWDLRTPNLSSHFISGPLVCGDALDIKDNVVLTGSWRANNAVQLWEFQSGKLIDTFPMKTLLPDLTSNESGGEFVYCARFANRSVVLAGGSGTQSVQAIDTNTKEVIGEVKLHHSVQAMDCHNDIFAVGGIGLVMKIGKLIGK